MYGRCISKFNEDTYHFHTWKELFQSHLTWIILYSSANLSIYESLTVLLRLWILVDSIDDVKYITEDFVESAWNGQISIDVFNIN